MSYLIYIAEGPSGAYIGLTRRSLAERMVEHKYSITRRGPVCLAFKNAILKYGFEGFQWTVLLDGLSADEADHMERFLIWFYKPRYNIAAGGFGPKSGLHSKAVVCINSDKWYATGKAAANELGLSQMTISNICRRGGATKSGLRFRFADKDEVTRAPRSQEEIDAGRRSRVEKLKARRHPPETIDRMRVAAKKRGVAEVTRVARVAAMTKPIVCIETGEVFPDGASAGAAHGLARGAMYALIRKGGRSTSGMSFRHL